MPKIPIIMCAIIKNTNKPFISNQLINTEQIIGPLIAPIPNINCNPPPAATNFSLGTKSLVCARFKENYGRHKPAYSPIAIKNKILLIDNSVDKYIFSRL